MGEYAHRLTSLEGQVEDLEGGRCRCAEGLVEEPSRVASPGLSAVGGNRMSPTLLASDEESMDREWAEGEMDLEAWADEWAVEQVLLADDGLPDSS